jgi:hypothetical protein
VQAGIEKCTSLRVLFMSNNKLKDWAELERLSALPGLEELLLIGNPLYNEFKDNNAIPQYRVEVRVNDPSSHPQGRCSLCLVCWRRGLRASSFLATNSTGSQRCLNDPVALLCTPCALNV